MKTKLAVAVTVSSCLIVFALPHSTSAHRSQPTPTPRATPTPYPTQTPQPLFIDTASEGYICSNGDCAFPSGNVDTSYSASITSGGGKGPTPYTWSVVAGSLPAGLSLTPSYGVYSAYIYGTPTTLQTSTFTLQVRDGQGDTARQAFTLTIDPPAALVITYPTLCCRDGAIGTAYSQGFANTGGVQPYTWSIASGQIPPGFSLCPSPPASLDGMPTTAGTFTFTVRVTDSRGVHADEQGSITIRSATPASRATLSSLAVSPSCVRGGTSATGIVSLTGPAPAGGAVVTLFNNKPAVATVPASVTVAAGSMTARITVSAKTVSAYTLVDIAASYGGQDQWAEFSVRVS
jgi:Putative Ig domain